MCVCVCVSVYSTSTHPFIEHFLSTPKLGSILTGRWVVGDRGDLNNFCEWLEKEKGVVVLLGSKASPFTYMGEEVGGNMGHCFRLSIAFYDVDKIVEGCKVLCDAVKEFFP